MIVYVIKKPRAKKRAALKKQEKYETIFEDADYPKISRHGCPNGGGFGGGGLLRGALKALSTCSNGVPK